MRAARLAPLADQVLANTSNWLFTVLVAGLTSSATFGRFAVGYTALTFAIAVWRNGMGYQISMQAGDIDSIRQESSRATAATLLLAPPLGLLILVVAGIGPSADLTLAIGLAVATPFVLVQDLLRYSAVASNRAAAALASDAVWAALIVAAIPLRIAGRLDLTTLISLWVVGSMLGTAIIVWALRIAPKLRNLRQWLGQSWRGRTHLVGGGLIAGASVPLNSALIAAIAGPEIAGGVVGAVVMMAPLNALVAWMSLTLLARSSLLDQRGKMRLFARTGAFMAALSVAWGFSLLLVPAPVGQVLLGQVWLSAANVMPLVGIQYAFSLAATTANLWLVAEGNTPPVLINGIVVALARLALGAIAAATVSTVLAAVVAETVAMAIWVVVALLQLRPLVTHTRSGGTANP